MSESVHIAAESNEHDVAIAEAHAEAAVAAVEADAEARVAAAEAHAEAATAQAEAQHGHDEALAACQTQLTSVTARLDGLQAEHAAMAEQLGSLTTLLIQSPPETRRPAIGMSIGFPS